MRARRRRTDPAFTLIEVLVALAVIAIGLLAVLAVGGRSGRVDAQLQQRAFADWVGENEVERLRLSSKWPSVGESNGKVTLADQSWHWDATVDGTADPDLRRITVTVAPAETPNEPVSRLIGFVGKPGALPSAGTSAPPQPSSSG